MKLLEFLQKSGCEANLARLMEEVIPSAVKKIKTAIEQQGGELAGSQNVYGEKQLALDVQSNQIVLDELKASGMVSLAASEELDDLVSLQNAQQAGSRRANHHAGGRAGLAYRQAGKPFTVVFDPLDGSSLVDVNFAVGSIFGVYPAGNPVGETGDSQLAACFAVYGPRTTLMITVKKGTHEFCLHADGQFYLGKENLKIADDPKHFAPGNLRAAAERADYLKLINEWIKNGLTLRYSGGMVPDINHILLKGDGIFAYPGYSKAPEGKLRLIFECNPMALLVEQAGGAASCGTQRILSKKIAELHQRTPIFIGSRVAVKACGSL